MMSLFMGLTLILTFAHAKFDAVKILRGRIPDHQAESFAYGGLMILFSVSTWIGVQEKELWFWALLTIPAGVITRVAFFDFSLNKFRGLSFYYISRKPNAGYETQSQIDKLKSKLHINDNTIRFIGIVLWLAYMAIHWKFN